MLSPYFSLTGFEATFPSLIILILLSSHCSRAHTCVASIWGAASLCRFWFVLVGWRLYSRQAPYFLSEAALHWDPNHG